MACEATAVGRAFQSAFDAIPSFVFILDREARILFANRSASTFFEETDHFKNKRLCGEVLHCHNVCCRQQVCGTTEECKDCVIRNGVLQAIAGAELYRHECAMSLHFGETVRAFVFFASVSPLEYQGETRALVVLEDISELYELRELVPICSWCKRVRSSGNYWEKVENYINQKTDKRLTHGICPDCKAKLMASPELNPPG